MAPPPSTAVSPVVSLLVRILTFVCLLISVILLVTNTYNGTVKFNDFYAYRYLLAATVLGLAYTLLQTALNIFLVSTGNRVGGDGMLQFDFYGDKVVSYMLATGAAASFGLTQDLKGGLSDTIDSDLHKFFSKIQAATSLCLIGFLLSAISSIFSSFSLPKRV